MELSASQQVAREALRKKAIDLNFGLTGDVPRNLWITLGSTWKEDILPSLEKVEGFTGDVSKFQIVDRRVSWRDRVYSQKWVKPDFELVEKAALERKALCVNKHGQFSLLESDFVALSHTWSEGLYADAHNRGIPRQVLNQLFQKLEVLGDAEWVWMDSLAVPGGDRDLNVEEEKVKVNLINNMNNIYSNAHTVLVIDALVLNLKSNDHIDVAFCLLCGRWRTRMWTYQEARLASRVKILTAAGPVDLHETIKFLEKLEKIKKFDKENPLGTANTSLLPRSDTRNIAGLLEQLQAIFGPGKVTLADVWRAGSVREAGQDIDYARAIFPVLGLTWSDKYDRERGMAAIYKKYLSEAGEFIQSFGAPRLIDGPGWAPSYLNDLDNHPSPVWRGNERGIESQYCCYKIRSVNRYQKDFRWLLLGYDQGGPGELFSWAWTHEREREKAILGFIDAVESSKGVLLIANPLKEGTFEISGKECWIVVLAAQTKNPNEVQVYLTAKIWEVPKVADTAPVLVTFSNRSPFNYETSEAESRIIERAFNTVVENDRPFVDKIHEYVRSDAMKELGHLLNREPGLETNAADEEGWTPLHWAVVAKPPNLSILKILLEHNHAYKGSRVTPLILAAAYSGETMIQLLLDFNLTHQEVQGVTPLTQALWSQRDPSIISLLISRGADVNKMDEHGRTPIFYVKGSEHLKLLLDAGADPSTRLQIGRPALHEFAINDWDWAIKSLVQHGAAVDIVEMATAHTALYHAVKNQNRASVRILLELYANPNRRMKDGKTLLIHAVEVGNFAIVENLLQAGAQVDVATTEHSWSPFHIAVRSGQSRILNLLLEQPQSRGAVWAKDNQGLSPYKLAERRGFTSMETMLKRRMENDEENTEYGLLVWVSAIITYLIQLYIKSRNFCPVSPDGDGTLSQSSEELESKKIISSMLLALFHALFSFQFMIIKALACFIFLLLWRLNQREAQFNKWMGSDLKRVEKNWRNARPGAREFHLLALSFGAVLGFLGYLGYLLYEIVGLNTAVICILLFTTLLITYPLSKSDTRDGGGHAIDWLHRIVILCPPWALAATYTGLLHWQMMLKIVLSILPSLWAGHNLLRLLRGELGGASKYAEDEPEHQRDHLLIDLTTYWAFVFVGIYLGWASLILLSINVFVTLMGAPTCLIIIDHAKKSGGGVFSYPVSIKGKLGYAAAVLSLVGSLGSLGYYTGWKTTIAIFIYVLASWSIIRMLLQPPPAGENMSRIALFCLTLLALTGLDVRFGWLISGSLSLIFGVGAWAWLRFERKKYA